MLKKLMGLILSATLLMSMSATAFAATPELKDGEYIVGDTIVGVPYVTGVDDPHIQSKAAPSCPNYAKSTENWQFFYDGYIQFKPSHETSSCCKHGIEEGRNVRRAYIDYRRDGSSVIGGAVLTTNSTNITSNTIISASAECTDTLIPGEEHTTYFYRGWFYFA